MTARKVVSMRLGPADVAFLSRRGLPLSVQLRRDLALVRALEEAELCKGGSQLLVRDVRRLARIEDLQDD